MGRSSLGASRKGFFFLAVILAMIFLASATILLPALAQQKNASTVDKTKMGPYRALARLAYASFQQGDNATASELGQILERV